MLVLLRVISTAAFATEKSKNIADAVALVKKSSSRQEDEGEETALERKKSTVSAADTTLNKLMAEGFAADILEKTDYSKLCARILDLVSQTIQRGSFTLEDKIIVENGLALWTGCILYKPDIFEEFMTWKNSD
jgi:hypothetical protein